MLFAGTRFEQSEGIDEPLKAESRFHGDLGDDDAPSGGCECRLVLELDGRRQ
jgi:hypothetical protein